MAIEYILFFHSYRDRFSGLSDAEFGRVVRAALSYSETGTLPDNLTATERLAFDFIRYDIDNCHDKYEAKCATNRANAAQKKATAANGSDGLQSEATAANGGQTKHKLNKTKTETKDNSLSYEREGEASPPAPTQKKRDKKPGGFTPPSVEEVRQYAQENGLTLDARRFVDNYTATDWKIRGSQITDWKAKARQWSAEDAEKAAKENDDGHFVSFDGEKFFEAAVARSYNGDTALYMKDGKVIGG